MNPLYDSDTHILHCESKCAMDGDVVNCETACGLTKTSPTDWKIGPLHDIYTTCEPCTRYKLMMELAE